MRTAIHILPLLVACMSAPTTFGQAPGFRLEFLPNPMKYDGGWGQRIDSKIVGDHLIIAERNLISNNNIRDSHVYAISRTTGKMEGHVVFQPYHKIGLAFDNLLVVDDRLYTIHETADKKNGYIDVIAQRYEVPSLEKAGGPIRVARIQADPKSIVEPMPPMGARFILSEDHSRVLFYFDNIRGSENQQLVLVHVFDGELNPIWSQGYRIDFESENIHTAGVEVGADGTVYALMRARFKNREITSKEINYTYELFRFGPEEMTSQPVTLPPGHAVVEARLRYRDGGPLVMGLYVDPGQSTRRLLGYFTLPMDGRVSGLGTARMARFKEGVEGQADSWQFLPRSGGGEYLVVAGAGTGWEAREHVLKVVSMGEDMQPIWETNIPRDLVIDWSNTHHGFKALLAGDDLHLVFPDGKKNLERYLAKEEPKKDNYAIKRVLFAASFGADGTPAYRLFSSDHVEVRFLRDFLFLRLDSSTYAAYGKRLEGKKKEEGFVFVEFDR